MSYVRPSPEEQTKRTAKSVATRRANIDARNAALKDAYERRCLLKDQIHALESRLYALQQLDAMSELANKVTGKTLISAETIVEAAKPWQRFTGVYFLIANKTIVYVGQSVNVYARLGSHGNKKFDSFAVITCPEEHLDMLESLYIHLLNPVLNGHDKNNCAPLNLTKILKLATSA